MNVALPAIPTARIPREPPSKRLAISFSGGRTSALMTWLLLQAYRQTHECVVTFANTGFEHEKTLLFVHKCDEVLGFNTVWLEAVVHAPLGMGTTHRVVNYQLANTTGGPFEQSVEKYGIPNRNFPNCTREMKMRPMQSYLKSLGWTDHYSAIGIRADEADRVNSKWREDRLWYPLVAFGITKQHVLDWWKRQPFDLEIPEHYGNCLTCWKKSDRKLFTIAKEHPEWFEFFARLEQKHKDTGAGDGNRRFFRQRRLTTDILAAAQEPFTPFVDGNHVFEPELDEGGACGESCEVGADEG